MIVKDINTGAADGMVSGLSAVNGRLYFMASDGVNGLELWTSDGTSAGTFAVKDICPGVCGGYPIDISDIGDSICLFAATDGIAGHELWQSNGTATGTNLVQDIAIGPGSSSPYGFTVVGDTVFFIADDNTTGRELWKVPVWINKPPPPGNGKKWGVYGNPPGRGKPRGPLSPYDSPGHLRNGPPDGHPWWGS